MTASEGVESFQLKWWEESQMEKEAQGYVCLWAFVEAAA